MGSVVSCLEWSLDRAGLKTPHRIQSIPQRRIDRRPRAPLDARRRIGPLGRRVWGEAAGVVFAVDFRQGTEQEVRDVSQDGGAARGNVVLDHENGQASQEGVDVGSALGSGEELVAELGGDVGFGLRDLLGGVARAEGRVAEDWEVAAASGGVRWLQ